MMLYETQCKIKLDLLRIQDVKLKALRNMKASMVVIPSKVISADIGNTIRNLNNV